MYASRKCPMNKHVLIENAVNDINCRLNNLLADFEHCSSKITHIDISFIEGGGGWRAPTLASPPLRPPMILFCVQH